MISITFDKNRYHEHSNMQQWCIDQFGYGHGWNYRHGEFGTFRFAFEEEIKYNWFILRWS